MSDSTQTPPKGDLDKAEKYVGQLVDLINQRKIEVYHTDLAKFDPTSLQDHYSINLKEYQIEISHSKHQETGKNSFVMIFNNLKNIAGGSGEKVILAYIYLADSQYSKFKIVADRFLEEKRRLEEEKTFREALAPIDNLLEQASSAQTHHEETPKHEETQEISSDSYLPEQQLHQI